MTTYVVDMIDLLDDSDQDEDTADVSETSTNSENELIGLNKIWCIPLVPLECMPFWKRIKKGRIPVKYIERSHHQPLRELQLHPKVHNHSTYRLKGRQKLIRMKKRWNVKQLYDKFCRPVSVVVKKMPLELLTSYMTTAKPCVSDPKQDLCCPTATGPPHWPTTTVPPHWPTVTVQPLCPTTIVPPHCPTTTVPPHCRSSLNKLLEPNAVPTKSHMEIIERTPIDYSISCNYVGSFLDWLVKYPSSRADNRKNAAEPPNKYCPISKDLNRTDEKATIDIFEGESTRTESKIMNNNNATIIVENNILKINYGLMAKEIVQKPTKYPSIFKNNYTLKQLYKLFKNEEKPINISENANCEINNSLIKSSENNLQSNEAAKRSNKAEKISNKNQKLKLKDKSRNEDSQLYIKTKAKTTSRTLQIKKNIPNGPRQLNSEQIKNHLNIKTKAKTASRTPQIKKNIPNGPRQLNGEQIKKFNKRGNIILVRAKPKIDNKLNMNISEKIVYMKSKCHDVVDLSAKKRRVGTKLKVSSTRKVSVNQKSQHRPPILTLTVNNISSHTIEPALNLLCDKTTVANTTGYTELPIPAVDTARNHAFNSMKAYQRERNLANFEQTENVNLDKALTCFSIASDGHSLVAEVQPPPLPIPIAEETHDNDIRLCDRFSNTLETRHIDDILVDVSNFNHRLVLLRIGKEHPVLTTKSGRSRPRMVFSETPLPLGESVYVACGRRAYCIVDFTPRDSSQLMLDGTSQYTTVKYNEHSLKVLPDGLDELVSEHYKDNEKNGLKNLKGKKVLTLNNTAEITETTESAEHNKNNNAKVHLVSRNIGIEYVTHQSIQNYKIKDNNIGIQNVTYESIQNSKLKDDTNNKTDSFQHDTECGHNITEDETIKSDKYDTLDLTGELPDYNKAIQLAVSDLNHNKSNTDQLNIVKCEDSDDFCDILIENCSFDSDDIDLKNIVIEDCSFDVDNLEDNREKSCSNKKEAEQNIDAGQQNSSNITVNICENIPKNNELHQDNFERNQCITIKDDNDSVQVLSNTSDFHSGKTQSNTSSGVIGDCKQISELDSVTTKFTESNKVLPSVNSADKNTNPPVGRIKVKAFAKLANGNDEREASNLDLIEANGRLYKRLNGQHAIYAKVLCSVYASAAVPPGRVFVWVDSEGLSALTRDLQDLNSVNLFLFDIESND